MTPSPTAQWICRKCLIRTCPGVPWSVLRADYRPPRPGETCTCGATAPRPLRRRQRPPAAQILAAEWPDGEGIRNELSKALSGWLLGAGYPAATVETLFREVCAAAGDTEVEAHLTWIERSAGTISRGGRLTGRKRASEIVSAGCLVQLQRALGPPPRAAAEPPDTSPPELIEMPEMPNDSSPGDVSLDTLEDVNRAYFVIEEGGKHFVAHERIDPVRQRRMVQRFTFDEFRKRHLAHSVRISGQSRPLTNWLNWPGRREFLGGVVFDPTGQAPANVYNLWRGWPIPPAPGDWTPIREHIRDVICGGRRELYRYVIGWLARMVQHPTQPGEVVLALQGRPGAGKTILGRAIKRMFGHHALSVSSARAVVGQFNAHLRDLVFLVADEAMFAGDRAAFGTLKALVTDPTLFIEQKGIDPVEVPNLLHILMTTNEEWVAPVSLGDRRFCVLDVTDSRVGDARYFAHLGSVIHDDRVIAAMLHALLSVPLANFQVRDIPQTKARTDQMVHSLDGPTAWLLHVLTVGQLIPEDGAEWPSFSTTRALHRSHETWAHGGKYRSAVDPASLGKFLRRFFPAVRSRADALKRGFRLGTLHEARVRFSEVTGLPLEIFGE